MKFLISRIQNNKLHSEIARQINPPTLNFSQNNTVFSNGFARRVASALPPMAEHLGELAELSIVADGASSALTNAAGL